MELLLSRVFSAAGTFPSLAFSYCKEDVDPHQLQSSQTSLSVDYTHVNLYPVLQGWPRTKDTFSDSSQPRTVRSRSSYKARTGVKHRNRRLRHPSGHQRCQVTTDRQTSSKASLQSRAGITKEGTSYRLSNRGSALSGLVLVSLNLSPP